MKGLVLLTALFWIGAFLTGLIIDLLDIYWIGHPSPHSESALFQIQAAAVLVTATAGAILYCVCLVVQRLKFVSRQSSTILWAMASGATYSAVLGLSGQGVLVHSGGTTGIGWMLLLLLPIGLSLLMRSSRLQSRAS
mgnify:CR=1 FL=1